MTSPGHRVVLSVGSNIDPERNVERAAEILDADHGLVARSQFIVTAPDGYQDQDDFLNGAFLVETQLNFDAFNAYLKDVEKKLGRVKGPIKSGPRTMDLDIIIWDSSIVRDEYYTKDYTRIPVDEILHEHGIEVRQES